MKGRLPWECLVLVLLLVCPSLPLASAAKPSAPASLSTRLLGADNDTFYLFSLLRGWADSVSYHQQKSGFPPTWLYTVIHARSGAGFLFSFSPLRIKHVTFEQKEIWMREGLYHGLVRPHRFHVFFCNWDQFPWS